jgi:predicted nucleotidyltransferase
MSKAGRHRKQISRVLTKGYSPTMRGSTNRLKESIKRRLVGCLQEEKEIRKIVVFGSFLTSPSPNDMDVAVFQDSREGYLSLSMKYRRLTRDIARFVPLDIIPVRMGITDSAWVAEIEQGEVIYEG